MKYFSPTLRRKISLDCSPSPPTPHSIPSFVVFAQTACFLRFSGSPLSVSPGPTYSFFFHLCCPCFVQFWFHSQHFLLSVGLCFEKEGPRGSLLRVHGGWTDCSSPFRPSPTCYGSVQSPSWFQLLIWNWSVLLSSKYPRVVGGSPVLGAGKTSHCFSLLSLTQLLLTWYYGCGGLPLPVCTGVHEYPCRLSCVINVACEFLLLLLELFLYFISQRVCFYRVATLSWRPRL